jgi:hypothetical protein
VLAIAPGTTVTLTSTYHYCTFTVLDNFNTTTHPAITKLYDVLPVGHYHVHPVNVDGNNFREYHHLYNELGSCPIFEYLRMKFETLMV